ncbi:MAG: hypothetical protein PHY54_10160 [Methylococcales bacterium]|nr:hypothetical protein [Methylococcales bacterium]
MSDTKQFDFKEITKNRIKDLFTKHFIEKNRVTYPHVSFMERETKRAAKREAEIFIRTLEGHGESIPDFEKYNAPKQQKRLFSFPRSAWERVPQRSGVA